MGAALKADEPIPLPRHGPSPCQGHDIGLMLLCAGGGGKAHGARLRDFNPSLNKKIRSLGLKMALSSKAKAGSLIVLEDLDLAAAKTAALKGQVGKLGFGKTTLVIDGDTVNDNFRMASANLVGINVMPAVGANVYDILKHDTLVLTRAAVEKLEARFNG
jgi:large subunit ribosomal protein L4